MKLYTLRNKQKLNIDKRTAWEYFSNPRNLEDITPKNLSFKITRKPLEDKMYPGMIVTYKISPFPFVSFNWVTEITQVRETEFFIDEQRFGPYRFWHHKHILHEVDSGKAIEMEDIVDYGLPFGWIGRIAGFFFIHKRIREIFTYREKYLNEKFNT